MRTAQLLKGLSLGVVVASGILAFVSFKLSSPFFWLVVFGGAFLGVMVRLLASIGQLVYEIRNESLRILGSVERTAHHTNAVLREIRDMVDQEVLKKEQ